MDDIFDIPSIKSLPEPQISPPIEADWFESENRQLVYQWFANLFAFEISAEQLSHFRGPKGAAFLSRLEQHAAFSSMTRQLSELASHDEDQGKVSLDLAGAFARVFLGAGGRHSAPPYQSMYLDNNQRLFQAPVTQMECLLRELELSTPPEFREPADHISVQLTVMAELVGRGEACMQLSFLDAHLNDWVSDFASACRACDRQGFYGQSASALVDWLKADREKLEEFQCLSVG